MDGLGRFKLHRKSRKKAAAAQAAATSGQVPASQPSTAVIQPATVPVPAVQTALPPSYQTSYQTGYAPSYMPSDQQLQTQPAATPTGGDLQPTYTTMPSPITLPPSDTPVMGSDASYFESESQYLGGLGQDDTSGTSWFSDIISGVKDIALAKISAQQTAAAQQAAAAQAAKIGPPRPAGSTSFTMPGLFLGLPVTTWMIIAGAGVGGYLLLSRRRR
jgi:hypothetical protein